MDSRKYFILSLLVCLLVLAVPPVFAAWQLPFSVDTPSEGKAFSEFNHHAAGVFLLISGSSLLS
jgi:hypothetical protein